MRYLGNTKIGKVQPNTNSTHPPLRLPQECGDSIGSSAHLYDTLMEGNKLFLAVLGDDPNIIQKMYNIIQNNSDDHVNSRLATLESEIKEIRTLLLLNQSQRLHENEKEGEPEWARPDSNRRPSPCQDGGFGGF